MKRSHITSALAILSVAFLVPLSASATTTTATASKSAPATTAKSATATKSATSAKTASASKIGLPHHHSTAKNASATKKAPKIDLNTATREELMTLPGVDGTMADKIIAERPYKSMSQLTSKKIVTKAEYAKIKSHVTARQSTMHSEAPATPAGGNQSAGAPASDAAAGTTDNSTTTK